MGIKPTKFESAGKVTEHIVPGVFGRSNSISSPSGVSTGNLCIMGKSVGGEPQKLLAFSSLAEAKETLIAGELLDGIANAFFGSTDYVPQTVYGMRVNTGDRASTSIKDNSNNDVIAIKAWDYGSHTNQLNMRFTDGSKANTYKIEMNYKGSKTSVDNIGSKDINITLADETYENASVAVTDDFITLSANKIIQPTETPSVEENENPEGQENSGEQTTPETPTTQTSRVELNISIDESTLLTEVVNRINDFVDDDGMTVFNAVLLNMVGGAKANELDRMSGMNTLENGYILTSNVQAIAKALSSIQYVGEVEIVSYQTPRTVDNVIYFEGGGDGSYSAVEWAECLEKLEVEDIQIISTPATEKTIQVLISNHCLTMSSTNNRKERTCFLGAPKNEAVEDSIKKAVEDFANKYVSYVVDSIIANNPITGETQELPGSYLACKLAGMECAASIATPLTNKSVNVVGFLKKHTESEYKKLVEGGCLPCGINESGRLVVIRAITTYQGDSLMDCERSMVRADLYMNRDLRQRLSVSIGNNGNQPTSYFVDTLLACAREWAAAGYIVKNDDGATVWDINTRRIGDKVLITFSRYLSAPCNFIFFTVNNYTYSSASVEV